MKEECVLLSNGEQQHLCNDAPIKDETDVKAEEDNCQLRIDESQSPNSAAPAAELASGHPAPAKKKAPKKASKKNADRPDGSPTLKTPTKKKSAKKKKLAAAETAVAPTVNTNGVEPSAIGASYGEAVFREEIVDGFSVLCFETLNGLENFTKRQQEDAEKCQRLASGEDTVVEKPKPVRKHTKKNKENVSKAAMKSDSLNAEPLKRSLDEELVDDETSATAAKVPKTDTPVAAMAVDCAADLPQTAPLNHDAVAAAAASLPPTTVIRQTDTSRNGVADRSPSPPPPPTKSEITVTPSRPLTDAPQPPQQLQHTPPSAPASLLVQQPPSALALTSPSSVPPPVVGQQNPFQALAAGSLFPVVGPPTSSGVSGNPSSSSSLLQQYPAAGACLPSTSHAASSLPPAALSHAQLSSLFPFSGLLSPYGGGAPAGGLLFPNGGVGGVGLPLPPPPTQVATSMAAIPTGTAPSSSSANQRGAVGSSRSSPSLSSSAPGKKHGRWCSMHVKIAWNIANKRYPPSAGEQHAASTSRPTPSSSSSRVRSSSSAALDAVKAGAASASAAAASPGRQQYKNHSSTATPNKATNDFLHPSLANGLPPVVKEQFAGGSGASALHMLANTSTSMAAAASQSHILSAQKQQQQQQQQQDMLMKSSFGGPASSSTTDATSRQALAGLAPSTSRMSATTLPTAPPPPTSMTPLDTLNLLQQQQQMMQMASLLSRNQTDMAQQYAAFNGAGPNHRMSMPPPPGFSSMGFPGLANYPTTTSIASAIATSRAMSSLPSHLFNMSAGGGGGGQVANNPFGMNLDQQTELLRRQSALLGLPTDFGAAFMEVERQRQMQAAAAAATSFNPFLPPGLAPSTPQQQLGGGGFSMEQFVGAQNLASLFQGASSSSSSNTGAFPFGALPPGVVDVSKLPFSNTLEQLARQKQHFGPPGGGDLLRR